MSEAGPETKSPHIPSEFLEDPALTPWHKRRETLKAPTCIILMTLLGAGFAAGVGETKLYERFAVDNFWSWISWLKGSFLAAGICTAIFAFIWPERSQKLPLLLGFFTAICLGIYYLWSYDTEWLTRVSLKYFLTSLLATIVLGLFIVGAWALFIFESTASKICFYGVLGFLGFKLGLEFIKITWSGLTL
jgi:hypothetical protein